MTGPGIYLSGSGPTYLRLRVWHTLLQQHVALHFSHRLVGTSHAGSQASATLGTSATPCNCTLLSLLVLQPLSVKKPVAHPATVLGRGMRGMRGRGRELMLP